MLTLARWNPFDELTPLHREMERVFRRSWGEVPAGKDRSWVPATEVTSGTEGWTVRMALPGIDSRNVRVDLHHNVLTVTGERASNEKDGERHVSEIGYGRFERSLTLPENVATEKVSASFEHGMLELTLPVSEAAKPRRIEIGTTAQKQVA